MSDVGRSVSSHGNHDAAVSSMTTDKAKFNAVMSEMKLKKSIGKTIVKNAVSERPHTEALRSNGLRHSHGGKNSSNNASYSSSMIPSYIKAIIDEAIRHACSDDNDRRKLAWDSLMEHLLQHR